ncbi:cytochrome bd-I ubiquinol oxidase subunit 1 apoprotein [Balneicella halophila]|uniref:Cytochrome bd-I ubiquinol oxidase subunit 1 apoprotein n=1 Tax=Balneicella halophila TaxID=1537566 RepID=A0A7L4UQV9_BALHA|nr:cytochrome ubiquinol oxidase subunit I [Balneicella halophila]PVX51902.1 cytochrome bd-I ubiquinol oxidase subunit 1 apoprotein [Balneicella halophila]
MIEQFDSSAVDWSRAQFALTAMYHWIFVPLTLGLAFIIAFMETIYYKTKNPEWKSITKFWMTIFGINFAIGVATGIILEFQFGTNWSSYSWFVGDIFGAPLAIEGIMAFFMESTFIAIMFFGWNKVSPKFHLTATWLTALGANLSALWILVANGWMQAPVGMKFNPETARNEMESFWDIVLSPTAVHKFIHTITSSYTLAAVVVVGISAWYLLKGRHLLMAKRSIVVGSVFGLLSILFTILSGDGSATAVAKHQPMKLAAMEGYYEGSTNAGVIAIGALSSDPVDPKYPEVNDFLFKAEIPGIISFLAFNDFDAFVPGVKDIMEGYTDHEGNVVLPVKERAERGLIARNALKDFTKAKKEGNEEAMATNLKLLEENYEHFGYSYFIDNPNGIIPNIPITFYSFHIMVILGFWFLLLFLLFLWMASKNKLTNSRLLLRLGIITIPLAYVASQAGWVVAELGRQPWVVQDLMPTMAAVSKVSASSIQITFWMFVVVFTALLIAELKILFKQIHIGPKEGGH